MSCCKDQELKHECVECGVPQRSRNNYFTGKLMAERDFKDEQRYFMGKERRHNQRLHGEGTVCGLKVKPHPNTNCQDQYVVIEPGMAIDCCGREILISCEENFDFKTAFLANWQAENGKDSVPDSTSKHTFQVCVRYKECFNEEVPALFDDCGCDDTSCKPNRILESYEFDVILKPKTTTQDAGAVQLNLDRIIGVADPIAVAVTDQTVTPKVFVLWQPGASATITTFDAATGGPLDSNTFAGMTGVDLAVSADGAHLYAALQPAAGDPQILVLDAANLAGAPVSTLAITGAGNTPIRLAVAPKPDARLFAAVPSLDQVFVWATDIDTTSTPAAPKTVAVGKKPVAIAFNQDGSFAYTANNTSADATAIKASDLTTTTIPVAGLAPTALAILTTAAGDDLAVLDSAAPNLTLVSFRPGAVTPIKTLGSVTTFPHRPVALAASPHGNWLYVLERDDTDKKGYLQTADPNRIATPPSVLGSIVAVGVDPGRVIIDAAGTRLYAGLKGISAATGGVAVIDVTRESCADIFLQVLEPCPSCEQGDCVVLATIKEYVYLSPVTGPQIDNRTDRHLLPSTEILTEVIECILEHPGGTAPGIAGPKGDPGDAATVAVGTTKTVPPGNPAKVSNSGTSSAVILDFEIPQGAAAIAGPATDVKVGTTTTVSPGTPASVTSSFSPSPPTVTLDFSIPKGDKGDPGDSATLLDLPHIVAINWRHGERLNQTDVDRLRRGLIIAFDKPVLSETITPPSPAVAPTPTFEVLFRDARQTDSGCFCQIAGSVTPGRASGARCGDIDLAFTAVPLGTPATAARFVPTPPAGAAPFPPGQYRVIMRGDFILGEKTIEIPLADGTKKTVNPALDANHMGPGLPKRCPTGDGIEGGTFESWFEIPRG